MERYIVVLERAGKFATIPMAASDYTQSVKTDKANNIKMRWGSGAMWNVLNVMDYDAYMNQTDSKPFKVGG